MMEIKYTIRYTVGSDKRVSSASGWFKHSKSTGTLTPDINDAYRGLEQVKNNCNSTYNFWVEEILV